MGSRDPREYFKAKYRSIEDIPGIGPATVTHLKEAGFNTLEAVAGATTGELIKAGVGEEIAKKIIEETRKIFSLRFVDGEEFIEMQKSIRTLSTGCSSLDKLLQGTNELHGGVRTQSINEFYGEFGSGKSQLCHQLCVTVQLPEEEGGLDGAALYIDTENVFHPPRIRQIAQRFESIDPKTVLKKVIMAEAYTSEHQIILLENADEVIKDNNVRLIIVDSLTGHFRSEYPGREFLARRQQRLNIHMHKLSRLSRTFNAAAVVTNQVQSVPDPYTYEKKPIGGNIVGHISHNRVFLRKGRNLVRIAKLVASPFLPEGEAPMRLGPGGVVSDSDIDAED